MSVPTQRQKYLFWLLLAAFSVFFAEVFAGSDMFPFFHFWGVAVLVPFYGLHALLLLTLVYRHGRPNFAALIFGGMLFGLYEAYNTKVLWMPGWGDATLHFGDLALVETLVLVFWWHTWFAFISPAVLAEQLFTGSRDVFHALPGWLQRLYGSRRGWLGLLAFGALFQSTNSSDAGQSLLSALGSGLVLTLLALWWRRATRGQVFTLGSLLPDRRQFRWLAGWLAFYYLFLTLAIEPERIPGLGGQLQVWLLYAVAIWGFVRALRQADSAPDDAPLAEPALSAGWLWLPLAFVVFNTLAEGVFAGAALPITLTGFLAGITFGLWAFVRALRSLRA